MEQKYQFFGTHSDKNPIIDLNVNDIQIGRKGAEKPIFNIKPSTSKHKEKAMYSSENRRSNQLIPTQDKKTNLDSSKQFHDLRMYLKAPRKK